MIEKKRPERVNSGRFLRPIVDDDITLLSISPDLCLVHSITGHIFKLGKFSTLVVTQHALFTITE